MEYTIGETAEKLNMSISTIRYYDKEGLLPFLKRSSSGIRLFEDVDLGHLSLIKCLKATDMPISEIKQFFDWYLEGDTTLEQRRNMFYERKAALLEQMEEMQETLETISNKCIIYDAAVESGTLHGTKKN